MRYAWMICAFALCLTSWGISQDGWAATPQQSAVIDFATKAVPLTLDYDQGNRTSLIDAQSDFTADAWTEFMKWLDGFVDGQGAPTGSSRFTATGDAVVKAQDQGVTRLSIRGILTQKSTGLAITTYHVVVELDVSDSLLKIQHLKVVVELTK